MRWRILALLFFARIGIGFHFQTLASVGDPLVTAFGLDYADVGLLVGLFMAPGLILALPAGYLGRLIADREMVVFGLMALALGGLISSLATGGGGVGAGRVVAGAGFLLATLYFTKMVADWFEGKEISTAMSIFVMSWPFGIAMGQVGHAWLSSVLDWRAPFLVASAYCFLAALAVFFFYRPPQTNSDLAASSADRMTQQEWRLILCAGTAWGAFNAAYVGYLTFGPKVLESNGFSGLAAAGVVSIASWLMIGSGAICGQIVDRFGRRDLVLTICMISAITALWMLSQPGAAVLASLLFGLVGMAPAGVIMALSGIALRPEVRASGMGIFFTIYYAFMLITPPAAGAIFDATGKPAGALTLAMVLFVSVVPLTLFFTFTKSQTK